MLRDILEAVQRGELEANSPTGKALVRRLEGAVAAFEADALMGDETASDADDDEPDGA